jgi:hypothetical protein
MLAIIGIVLLVLWLLGYLAFHLAVGIFHILPVIALILILMHFLRRKRSVI